MWREHHMFSADVQKKQILMWELIAEEEFQREQTLRGEKQIISLSSEQNYAQNWRESTVRSCKTRPQKRIHSSSARYQTWRTDYASKW